MSEESNHNFIIGAAVVAGVLGTLSALMRSNSTVQGWTEQAREAASHAFDKGETFNKNMLLGGVAGGMIGAATALLLAPKAGSELMKDIAHHLAHPGELVHSSSRKASSSRKSSRSKATSHKKSGKEEAKSTENGKSRKSASKKKSAPRRRTATAALKATTTEKGTSETAEAAG